MKFPPISCLAVVVAVSTGYFNSLAEQIPSDSAGDVNNAFALRLYASLRKTEGNLFFSPYSISTCLSMACEGAHGSTKKQMESVLNPEKNKSGSSEQQVKFGQNPAEGQYELNIANALWCQTGFGFLPAFKDVATRRYGAELQQVDFKTQAAQAAGDINRWVSEKTKGKIRDVVSPGSLNENTEIVLANAIYFKGTWAEKFDSNVTRLQPFSVSTAHKVNVQLMEHLDEVPYLGNETFQAVDLPYTGESLSMLVFLPRKVDGLAQLESWLNPVFISRWCSKMKKQPVNIYLPRFQMASSFDLQRPLTEMGMPDAFSSDLANFSGINGATNLFISSVLHKAWVDVAEEGTEAAAATVTAYPDSVGEPLKVPPPPPIFRADHPFIFLIRQKSSGNILFLGRVEDPSKSATP